MPMRLALFGKHSICAGLMPGAGGPQQALTGLLSALIVPLLVIATGVSLWAVR